MAMVLIQGCAMAIAWKSVWGRAESESTTGCGGHPKGPETDRV